MNDLNPALGLSPRTKASPLCKYCQQIDFDKVLNLDTRQFEPQKSGFQSSYPGREGIIIADLGEVLSRTDDCGLCEIFKYHLAARDQSSKEIQYELRAFSLLTNTSLVEPTINDYGLPEIPKPWYSLDQPYLLLIPKPTNTYFKFRHWSTADRLRLMFAFKTTQASDLFIPRPVPPMIDPCLVSS